MPSNVMEFQAYQEAFSLGLTKVYKNSLQNLERSYTAFLKEETAEHYYDTDWSVSGFGPMPTKAIGQNVTTDTLLKSPTKQYSITPYALGCVIEYEAVRWNLYGIFDGLAAELAKSATDRYNIVGHAVLANGFVAPTAEFQIYSGENIFSTAHVRLDGGTWSNRSSSDIGLSYLGLQAANIDLQKTPNERGMFIQLTMRKLITAPDLAWIADTLINSEYRPDNANQSKNTVKGKLSLYSSPYLTSPLPWFVGCDKDVTRIKMRLGDSPKFDKDSDIRQRNLVQTSYCSFGLGVFDSRGLWGSLGTA